MVKKKSLKEIAAEAGVSAAMVSQIRNGTGRASEKVRNKVTALLEESGYKPRLARFPYYYIVDLPRVEASGKTQKVLEQLSGIQQVFDENRLTLHVEFIRSEPAEDQLKMVAERKPSGVFINTDADFLNTACDLFHAAGIPLVQIGYDTENPKYNAVVMDGFSGAYTAISHFIKQGHRRIGMLRFTAGVSGINSNKKYAGYRAALADAGIVSDNTIVKVLNAGQGEAGWKPARMLIEEMMQSPEPPTAVFIDNSYISLSLMYPLSEDGGHLPQAIQKTEMIHFEDWPIQPVHDMMSNKLFYDALDVTLVCIDWEKIGQQAAELLIRQVGQTSPVPDILRVSPALYRVRGDEREPILE